MENTTGNSRRSFISGILTVGLCSMAGCADPSQNKNVKDTDGDGVIDSQDYAPKDASVQSKGDLRTEDIPEVDFQNTNLSNVNAESPTPSDGGTFAEEPISPNPDPTVTDIRHPDPRAVSVDSEHQFGNYYNFYGTVENVGNPGDVGITLVYLHEPDGSVRLPAKVVRSQDYYFSAGERRTVKMSADREDRYEGFGFRFWAAEIEADVRNMGGRGTVRVKLVNEEGIAGTSVLLDERTIDLGDRESTTVLFDGDYDTPFFEDIAVETEIV